MKRKQNQKATDLITLADVTDAQLASMDRAECRAYVKKGVVPERFLQTRPVLVQQVRSEATVCTWCGADKADPQQSCPRCGAPAGAS
jgi:hypothetical protein